MKKFNINVKENKKHKRVEVLLEGDLTINNSNKLNETFMSLEFPITKLVIELKNVENIDITLLQMIYALKKTLSNKEDCIIKADIPKDIRDVIQNSGLIHILETK